MCGIAGYIDHHDRQRDPHVVERMLDLLRHRGPDSEGHLALPEMGLQAGMRRLSIIDLETGDQPVWNEDRSIAVLFNGEIYNYRELRRDLQQRGHHLTTEGDTEVLVHLYEDHSTGLFPHLRGMYGVALIDRPRRRLILARDPFGQKHLYWTRDPGGRRFAFASELKALRALPWVDFTPRTEAVAQ